MAKKAKAKPIDRASPVIAKGTHTDSQKVRVAREITAASQKNPGWATATDLQAAAKVWTQAADDIEANAKIVGSLKADLRAAESKQQSFRRTWRAAKKQVLGATDVLCAGSADEVKGYGFDVRSHGGAVPVTTPSNLATAPGAAAGEAVFTWDRGGVRHGFIVQHARDVANAATFSAPIASTKSKYVLEGAQSASTAHFRVAAIDPSSKTGQTQWSEWVAATVH